MTDIAILKEKDIIKYLIDNWENFFKEDMFFHKKECKVDRSWRCDLIAYRKQLFEDKEIKSPIYIEVKYNNNHRDLLYELSKGLFFLSRPAIKTRPRHLCVFIEDKSLDKTIEEFMKEKRITYYIFSLKNDDLNTLQIECVQNCFDEK